MPDMNTNLGEDTCAVVERASSFRYRSIRSLIDPFPTKLSLNVYTITSSMVHGAL